MVFKLSATPDDTFDFQIPGEKKTHSLPLIQNLPLSLRRPMIKASAISTRVREYEKRNRKYKVTEEDLEIILDAQQTILEEYVPGIMAKLTDAQFNELMSAWAEASTVTTGESSGS